jgi:hypothetical protein
MSEQDESHKKKADGSAMDAHRAEVAERNAAASKAGRERRKKQELEQAQRRNEVERRLNEALLHKG